MNCGTTLIYEAVGHSKEYEKAANAIDSRIHRWAGGLIGFFSVAVLLKFVFTFHLLSDGEIYSLATGAGVVGSILGRLLLGAKRRL